MGEINVAIGPDAVLIKNPANEEQGIAFPIENFTSSNEEEDKNNGFSFENFTGKKKED